jgi:hypothetical protein
MSKWIDVKEKLPDEIGAYLGHVIVATGGSTITRVWFDNTLYYPWYFYENDNGHFVSLITHWMPLPEKPPGWES